MEADKDSKVWHMPKENGELMVFKVYDNVSYALIVKNQHPIRVGDYAVINPTSGCSKEEHGTDFRQAITIGLPFIYIKGWEQSLIALAQNHVLSELFSFTNAAAEFRFNKKPS